MPFSKLKQSAHLRLQRVSSPDEFRAIGFLELERHALLGPYFYGRARTALETLPGLDWNLIFINNHEHMTI